MKTRKKAKFFPYGMMMPTIVIFGLFMIYPVVYSFYLSFMEFSGGTYTFVGLQNYIELFKDPVFYKALFNTFFYLIIQVPVMIGLALLLAVLIEQKFIRGRGFSEWPHSSPPLHLWLPTRWCLRYCLTLITA